MQNKAIPIAVAFVILFIQTAFAASSLFLLKQKKLAIVIDDMGYDVALARRFKSLNMPLAFAFLPDAPFSGELSRDFSKNGFVVMIHMPSQPLDYPKDNPGKHAIYLWTSKADTLKLLNWAYKRIPNAMGLNNHMGSAILRDKPHMDYIMEFLKEHGLFFIDSATVKDSIGCAEAKKFGVMCARRRVFIDNKKDVLYIKGQLRRALAMLKKRNDVVAIGHCNEKTYEALFQMRKQLKPYLVSVVFVLK
ncbi:divergent polysaccharide deacetylase family protein [Hippea sp. KM1]|uniref:divergent polysaccharide deacetylase family protein n=1 Tax=Hippea sp. KM1 TaxID=944481 RepID=UPI00046D55D8|nr:divergent polysaccharide deacetylase family protein [Hippea sp. KM1]